MKSDTKSNVDLMARKVALRKVLVEDYWSGGGRLVRCAVAENILTDAFLSFV